MKRIILVLTAALLLAAMMVTASPAFAQEKKEDTKKDDTKKEEKKEEKNLPQSGGIPVNPAVLSLGAGALLVGGGLVAARVSRRH